MRQINYTVNYHTASFKDAFTWIVNASKIAIKRPFLHIITTISLALIFAAILFLYGYIRINPQIKLIGLIIFSFIFPMISATMAVTSDICNKNIHGVNYPKYILARVWQSGVLRTILIYILISTAISLGANQLLDQYPNDIYPNSALAINFITQIMLILLQIVVWIAVPFIVYSETFIQPFHVLGFAFKSFINNFFVVFFFLVINMAILGGALTVLYGLMNYLHQWTLILFAIVLLKFLSWFGISCAEMSRNIISN